MTEDFHQNGQENVSSRIQGNGCSLPENVPSFTKEQYRKKTASEKFLQVLNRLLPIRCSKQQKGTLPNYDVGFLSYATLQWMDKWMWSTSRHGIETNEVPKIHKRDSAEHNSKRLKHLWTKEICTHETKKVSFLRTIWYFNHLSLLVAALMNALGFAANFVLAAWILKGILDFMNSPDLPTWNGIVLVIALSAGQFLRNVAYSIMWVTAVTTGTRTQGAIQTMIYDKILAIEANNKKFTSEVVNYITTDIERIFQAISFGSYVAGGCIMWILNITYCFTIWGTWSLLANFVSLLYYPIMIMIGKKISQLRREVAKVNDGQIQFVNEVLSSIKFIKMYAWEDAFLTKFKKIRSQEERILNKIHFLQSVLWSLSPILSVLSPMMSIIGMTLTGHHLSASEIFTMLSVFACLQHVQNTLPITVKNFSDGFVSCQRIEKFLTASNSCALEDNRVLNSNHAINIINVHATWTTKAEQKSNQPNENNDNLSDSTPDFSLQIEELIVQKGQLLGIYGNVGTGKSTLLETIAGNANVIKGSLGIQGKVAYATQSPWLFNATIRENIIFGLPFEHERYEQILLACCLLTDLSLMPNGDSTEIIQNGANLSGGQKQRIHLARAFYSNRDIYLLDDTFSSLDNIVAKHIFVHAIKNILQKNGKTVLLVTDSMQFLEKCDCIIVMKDGTIIECGTHVELIQENGKYAKMFELNSNKQSVIKAPHNSDESCANIVKEKTTEHKESLEGTVKLIKEELDKSKSVTWKSCLYFCKQCGGYIITSSAIFTIILFNLLIIFNGMWIQIWIDAGCDHCHASIANEITIKFPQLQIYVIVYGASGITLIFIGLIKGIAVGRVLLRGATEIQQEMFWKIVRSPMSFFDVTPLGRIINRFSRDMDELNNKVPFFGEFWCQALVLIIFQVIITCYYLSSYVVGVVVILLMIAVYLVFDEVFNKGVLAMKRTDNLLRPPLLVHLSTTIDGLATIHCFENQKMMSEKFQMLVDQHLAASFLFQLSRKWISFRVDAMTWLVMSAIGFIVVFSKGTMSVATAGFCMLQIIRISAMLGLTSRVKSDLMARMISLERIVHYCKNLKEEAPFVIYDNRPPAEWPQQGAINVANVKMQYHPELPLALRGISMTIKGGEKHGIFGRTGAGKSSIIEVLLRIRELNEGKIIIDDIDIAKIGLGDLRSKIATITQEPKIFEGTLRWNLDPFNIRTDEEIWNALEKAYLKEKISNEPGKLEKFISQDTSIFSLGEMKLFCLARALLKYNKILLLDEATASVDIETDGLIQQSIREAFATCTVLIIAHKLNTMIDCDKITGIEAGQVVEVDLPQNLLSRDSLFNSMIKSL